MADTLNKPKLQLRNSFNANANDKTPSPATKLLLNHGKPNFTIQKTPNGNGPTTNPLSPLAQNGNSSDTNNNNGSAVNNNPNNNYNPYKTASVVVKSTKFNGVFNAASITTTTTQKTQSESNEATKVVLRKVAKSNDNDAVDGEDANVPEFIRRQRRIQERLAKENLDFENRRSGYFTHVVITPTSPNRSSFAETMASPAVITSLEMPVTATQAPQTQQATVEEESEQEVQQEQQQAEAYTNGHSNGHVNTPEEEEEVAKAIEEVNKAVAGEDDTTTSDQPEEEETVEVVSGVGPVEAIEVREQHEAPVAVARSLIQSYTEELHSGGASETAEEHSTEEATPAHIEAHVEIKAEALVEEVVTTAQSTVEHIQTNGNEHAHENGHAAENGDAVTISHTNGVHDGPHIPSPDPSGALGVNFEPKTVVSFSKDLGADENKYPDTVKVVKEGAAAPIDPELQDIAKLKFDITADGADVTPVLRTD